MTVDTTNSNAMTVGFSPDDKTILVETSGGTALYDIPSGKRVLNSDSAGTFRQSAG